MRHTVLERDGRWHATILEEGGQRTEKSFATLNRAKAWVSRCEAAKARYANPEGNPATVYNTTLGDILLRYGREVSSLKKGAKEEGYRINRLAAASIGGIRLADLTPMALATYRNDRLAVVANNSVRSEMSLIRRSIEYARREWGFEIATNPAALVTLPRPGIARDRRLQPGEYEKLEAQLKPNPVAWAFVRFAIETAMRRGEIMAIKWRHVRPDQRMVYLPVTKTGRPRTVPLTDGAIEVLEGLPQIGEDVFPIDPSALRWAWGEACRKAGIVDLRLHDLRHEGVSRLFEMELSVPEVALISGHKTPAMLFRYVNLMPVDLARKLKGRKRAVTPI